MHLSDVLVGTYSDQFEQRETIALEMPKNILAILMDRIDTINGRHQKEPVATQADVETAIDNEDV